MSQKVQRNALCPCGSGKKYKKCCLLKAKDESNQRYDHREGVQKSLIWLNQTYRPQIDQWVEQFWFSGMSEVERQGVATADAQLRAIHDVNVLEILLAEGRFSDEESEATPLQLVLNEQSLELNESQQSYLAQLTQRPLRLYAVVSRNLGKSFTVEDVLADETFDVFDAAGSRIFETGDYVGLRMMKVGETWETSGAIYHIPTDYQEALKHNLSDVEGSHSQALASFWLKLVAAHV
ncbi:MAG: SEC-C metal-binding domain-containing protein [Mariprofundaceae bacterium]|nr:SEC-C metal-binding domain-containing protein [Mariprofundaceae bacterium]